MASTTTLFYKLHGLGNDFVLLDHLKVVSGKYLPPSLTKARIQLLGDRKRGVGFDQLLVLNKGKNASVRLYIYNTDGSRAEMCGNGLRAAALHLWTAGYYNPSKELMIHTDVGLLRCRVRGHFHRGLIETEMGEPRFPQVSQHASVPKVQGIRPVLVNVGNPHAVYWLTPPRADRTIWLRRYGGYVENHRAFPRRTNVEFATIRGRNVIDVIVWERGVGLTEACGTGAVAVATAAISEGLCQSPVKVRFPGGTVTVDWHPGKPAFLTGKAEYSYSGQFYWSS